MLNYAFWLPDLIQFYMLFTQLKSSFQTITSWYRWKNLKFKPGQFLKVTVSKRMHVVNRAEQDERSRWKVCAGVRDWRLSGAASADPLKSYLLVLARGGDLLAERRLHLLYPCIRNRFLLNILRVLSMPTHRMHQLEPTVFPTASPLSISVTRRLRAICVCVLHVYCEYLAQEHQQNYELLAEKIRCFFFGVWSHSVLIRIISVN
jgi:hypothetical protein